ncbi:MAG: lysine exporter LysO family protein, partial [Acidaminococcaceae bacterium]
MIFAILSFITAGIAGGYYFLNLGDKTLLDTVLMSALSFMVLVAGIEIGGNRHLLKKFCNPQNILLAVSIPLAIMLGSLLGAAASASLTGLSVQDSLLIGAGLGWYSLSSVVISTMYSVEIGTISFLANMLRETMAFVLIPLLVKWNKLLVIAPAGAATMDSGLPMIIKYTNIHMGMYAFLNGLILTLLIPFLLPIF